MNSGHGPGAQGGGNPWVAVRPGEDVDVLRRRLSSAHRSFVDRSSEGPQPVRSVVFDSWLRSRRKGVSPDGPAGFGELGEVGLAEYRAAHPMSLIEPVVRRLLVEDAAESGLLIAMSDERGRLLRVDGDRSAKDRALEMNFVEGADWSEGTVGTNAPGTALEVDHCVQIFGAEHFSRSVHEWSCTAAPVHDPTSGLIVGAIDITGGPRVAVPEVLSLVRATVAAAESELRLQLLSSPARQRTDSTRLEVLSGSRPVLIVDGIGRTVSRRHAEILLLLSEYPEGLTSEHLAVLLDEGELDSVTIRAEVSRLRKVFGAGNIASRPYRIVTDLGTDVQDVRSALDRGDVGAAMRIFGGPVLPESFAPGVEEVREELRVRVQAGLLRQGDQRLLAKWTTSVHGRSDPVAWQAYLAGLDPASPLYSQVQARIDLFDHELR